ncbi:MAG: hypothetical protein JST00_07145 [Deltaproteobacteria bacterium]|nr:hypothetical protein [Deltaproteobacteria bacterium]
MRHRALLSLSVVAVFVAAVAGCESPPIDDALETHVQSAPLIGRSAEGYTTSKYLTFPWYYFAPDRGVNKGVPLYLSGVMAEARGQIGIDLFNQTGETANVTLHFVHPETGQQVMNDVTTQVSSQSQVEVLVGKTPEEQWNESASDLYFNVFVESSAPIVGFVTSGLSWGAGATLDALENDPAIAAASASTPPDRPMYPELRIDSATYGKNCGAPQGNATAWLQAACTRDPFCGGVIEAGELGDPAPGCRKDFTVTYRCGTEVRSYQVPADAAGASFALDCMRPYDPGCTP